MSQQTGPYPVEWEFDALLADGATLHIRPIRPADVGALVAFHAELSPETVHCRFFGAHPRLSEAEAERFTEVDHRDRFALVAIVDDVLAGVARYERSSWHRQAARFDAALGLELDAVTSWHFPSTYGEGGAAIDWRPDQDSAAWLT